VLRRRSHSPGNQAANAWIVALNVALGFVFGIRKCPGAVAYGKANPGKLNHSSFVVDMTLSPEGLALVSTIINLAHALKLKVVAEGVETAEQSRLLQLLGCDEMQGFLISEPVPCATFEAHCMPEAATA